MAVRRCCDGGGDLAVPSDHRVQGVVSGLLGAWQGRRKRKPLGAWAGVAETSIPHCKVAPGWHPAVVRHGVHGAPRQDLAWHSWCGSSGSSPVPCKSHHSCCPVEMCFAGMCSMWSCTGVVLHGEVCVHVPFVISSGEKFTVWPFCGDDPAA